MGIFVLEETNAATKTIAKNNGIPYSRVSVVPPWLKPMILFAVAAAPANIAANIFTSVQFLF
jgi:hypothetical protein